ncbi:histidinol-phosphate transaminase [Acidobacteriota bacterium]
MLNIKESVLKLDGYVVSQDFSRVKLNQNESPFDVPLEIKQEISEKLTQVNWNRYPNNFADPLKRRISQYINFPRKGIIVGNSSTELIQTVMHALCNSYDRIVVTNPGFPIYKRLASILNIKVEEVPLSENFSLDTDALIEKSKGAKIVFLSSPNNPTGNVLSVEDLTLIAGNITGILVVDEAYYEFYKDSAQHLIKMLKNIIIIRTFSKAFNLAGIRLGYMLGNDEVLKELGKAKLPFSIGIFQQLAGEVVMANMDFVKKNVLEVVNERERVYNELKRIPFIHPFPSYANFILFRSKTMPAKDLFRALYDKGVVLRTFKTPELRNCLRVTLGTKTENGFFLRKLKEVMSNSLK